MAGAAGSSGQRMSESDGAALYIHTRIIGAFESEFLHEHHSLHGEGFVEFNETDILHGKACAFKALWVEGTGPSP